MGAREGIAIVTNRQSRDIAPLLIVSGLCAPRPYVPKAHGISIFGDKQRRQSHEQAAPDPILSRHSWLMSPLLPSSRSPENAAANARYGVAGE